MFAYVPQGNLLLSGTLRENLVIANPDASEEELPQGLDTPLGENGAGLSEGQALYCRDP